MQYTFNYSYKKIQIYEIVLLFFALAGMLFFSYMVEDQNPGGPSYVEFLVHIHRQIQVKCHRES